MTTATILVAGAEPDTTSLQACLTGLGHTVSAAVSSASGAVEAATRARPDLALVDLGPDGGSNGFEVAEALAGRCGVPVVYLVADSKGDLLRRARGTDPYGYVLKPFDARQLHLNIDTALAMVERERKREREAAGAVRDGAAHGRPGAEVDEWDDLPSRARILETVVESMREGVIIADRTENYRLVNSSVERIFGVPVPVLRRYRFPETYGYCLPDGVTPFPPDDLPITRAIRRGEPSKGVEVYVRNPEGTPSVFITVDAQPLRDARGSIVGGFGVIRNVTEFKEMGDSLRRTVEEMRFQTRLMNTVFDTMSDGLIATDADREPVIYNRAIEAVLGPHVPGLKLEEISAAYGIHLPDQVTVFPSEELPLIGALRGEPSENVKMFVRNRHRPEGVYISVSARPLLDESGAVAGSVITARDVTLLERTELELRRSNQALQRQSHLMDVIFNTISDGVIVADAHEKYLMRNRATKRLTGEYVQGTTFERVSETYGLFLPDGATPFPPDDLPLTRAVRRGESTDDVEMVVRNRDWPAGRYLSVSGRPLRDEGGSLRGGAIVIRDITESKKLELDLRETIDKLEYQSGLMRIVFHNIDAGLAVWDDAGRYLMHNPAMERITGVAGEDLGPDRGPDVYALYRSDGTTLIPWDDQPLIRAVRGVPTDAAEVIVRTCGKPEGVPVRITGRPLRDESGVARGGVSIYHDLTEIKEAESRLRQAADDYRGESQTLQSVFDSIGEAVTVTDDEGEITRFNPAAERIIGVGMVRNNPERWNDEHGVFFLDRATPIPHDELPQIRALRGEPVDDMELFLRNPKVPDGVYLNVNANPVRDARGEVQGSVIAFRDVTERHLAEEALSEAFAEGRLEIIDTLLHNVGNAVNSVATGMGTMQERLRTNRLGRRLSALADALEAHRDDWAAYLESDPQGRKVIPFLVALARDFREQDTELRRIVDRVEERVQHIVDIVRTQKTIGVRRSVRKDVNLRRAIDDVVRMLQESIAGRGIDVRVDCGRAPDEIRIEESRFHQMLVNLVKNAVEAIDDLAGADGSEGTEARPRIRIDAYVEGDYLVVDVIDNGIGIGPDQFKLIFAPGFTSKVDGSGLGLHASANFAIASGGRIQPLSEGLGKGTTMRVRLRLSTITPSARQTDFPPPAVDRTGGTNMRKLHRPGARPETSVQPSGAFDESR